MKIRTALSGLLLLCACACGQRDADTAVIPMRATDRLETFVFVLPGDAIEAVRFDPTSAAGEEILIRRILLVESDASVTEMDACAPTTVQRVRVTSFTRFGDDCSIVFGDARNAGWMGLTAFGSLDASASERHVEIDMTIPAQA